MNRNQKHIQALLDLATVGEQADGMSWYRRANTAAVRLSPTSQLSQLCNKKLQQTAFIGDKLDDL